MYTAEKIKMGISYSTLVKQKHGQDSLTKLASIAVCRMTCQLSLETMEELHS